MPTIHFLSANVPLTKTFIAQKDGSLKKDAYPLVANVTSYNEEVETPLDLFNAIKSHAEKGHCLLKGTLTRDLTNESRRGTTTTDGKTQWVCLDFDRHECADLDEVLVKMGLGDVTYVLQYSASHGLDGYEGTISAHVFMMLSDIIPAPSLKAWLMDLNFKHLSDDLHLSRTNTLLRWPLDITTCQNDKLLYIATPTFKGLKDPLKARITIVAKKLNAIPVERVGGTNITALKVQERKLLNDLRKNAGLPARVAKTTWVGNCEVQNKPDVAEVSDVKDCGEFIRLNINGGDSWAYWHHKDNFELIHDFKSDTWYKTKELLPGYYSGLLELKQRLTSTPTEDGDLILAFRDLKSSDYYNGLWNPTTNNLELYKARNETQLEHWMRSHGRVLGDFIPIWDIQYDVQGNWMVDAENHKINLFVPSRFMSFEPDAKATFPTILGIIQHMLGCKTGVEEDDALVAHFLNWFACIFQRKHKPLTAWVTHGIEGTGKGFFINKIASQLLGSKNAMSVTVSNVEDQFNGWLEGKLLVLIDEVDIDDFREKGKITAKLRNYITEPTMALRRMRQQTIDVPNNVSFIFSSNRPQPVYIPETDRRYNVGNFQKSKLARPDDGVVMSELEKFAAWLLAQQVDIQAANTVMQTEARARIAKLSVTSMVETCNFIKTGDFDALWSSMPDERLIFESGVTNQNTINAQMYAVLMKRIAKEIVTTTTGNLAAMRLSRDELLIIIQYNVGNVHANPHKFTSLLRHNGIDTRQMRLNGMKTYGVDVQWVVTDELRQDLIETLKLSKPALKSNLRKIK